MPSVSGLRVLRQGCKITPYHPTLGVGWKIITLRWGWGDLRVKLVFGWLRVGWGGVKNYHPQRGVGWYGGELVIGLRVGWGGVKIIVYFLILYEATKLKLAKIVSFSYTFIQKEWLTVRNRSKFTNFEINFLVGITFPPTEGGVGWGEKISPPTGGGVIWGWSYFSDDRGWGGVGWSLILSTHPEGGVSWGWGDFASLRPTVRKALGSDCGSARAIFRTFFDMI